MLLLAASLVVVGLGIFVMVWFQPQKLFIDNTVDEALPDLVLPPATEPATDEAMDDPVDQPIDEPTDESLNQAADEAMDDPMDDPMAPSSLADFQALAVEQGAPQVVTFGDFTRLTRTRSARLCSLRCRTAACSCDSRGSARAMVRICSSSCPEVARTTATIPRCCGLVR